MGRSRAPARELSTHLRCDCALCVEHNQRPSFQPCWIALYLKEQDEKKTKSFIYLLILLPLRSPCRSSSHMQSPSCGRGLAGGKAQEACSPEGLTEKCQPAPTPLF